MSAIDSILFLSDEKDQRNLKTQNLAAGNLSNASVNGPTVQWVEDTSEWVEDTCNNKGNGSSDDPVIGFLKQMPQLDTSTKKPDLFRTLWAWEPNRPDTQNRRYSVARERKASLVVASRGEGEGLVSTKRSADQLIRLLKRLRAENESSRPVEDSQDFPLTQSSSGEEVEGLTLSGERLAFSEEGAVWSGEEFTPSLEHSINLERADPGLLGDMNALDLDKIICETDEGELKARQEQWGVSFASTTLRKIVSKIDETIPGCESDDSEKSILERDSSVYTPRPPHYFESDDPNDPITDSEGEASENEESACRSVESGAFVSLDFESGGPEEPIEPTILQMGEDDSDANAYLLDIPIGNGDVDVDNGHKADIFSKIDSFGAVLDKNLNQGLNTKGATGAKETTWRHHNYLFFGGGALRRTDHDSRVGYVYSDFVMMKK